MKFALNFIWIEMFSLKVKYLISLMVQSFIFFETPPPFTCLFSLESSTSL